MTGRLSSEMLHATTVAKSGRAVVITGRSGSGKSDLALRLFDRGFVLVSDDQTLISRFGDRLIASAPRTISGMLEVRGIGIVEMSTVSDVPVCLVVELADLVDRMPKAGLTQSIIGIALPLMGIDGRAASAPAKVELALDRIGLDA